MDNYENEKKDLKLPRLMFESRYGMAPEKNLRQIYEDQLNDLIKDKNWKKLFELKDQAYHYVPIGLDQNGKQCFFAVSRSRNSLKFVIRQTEEICLASLSFNIESLVHIRIPLKKETIVKIDLLYGYEISKRRDLKTAFNKLSRESNG